MSNYEKLRTMTASELAAFLEALEDNGAPWNDSDVVCNGCASGACSGCNLTERWLMMEVSE